VSIKALIRIADKTISAFDKLRLTWKRFKQRRKVDKIRKAIDDDNVDAIERIVYDVKAKQQNRNDET